MRTITASRTKRDWLLVGLLALGWAAGGARHLTSVLATTWGDITPDLLVLGLVLAFLAGAVTRVTCPERTARWGAIGGLLMGLAIMVATMIIDVILVMPLHAGESGETWFTFLLEAWFWIGVPCVATAGLGLLGWWTMGLVGVTRRPNAR